jgi:hypothetical protein
MNITRPTVSTARLAGWLSVTGLAAAASVLAVSPAQAGTPQDEYAAHVVDCQEHHGFDGAMNPGMHLGRSAWDPAHACAG